MNDDAPTGPGPEPSLAARLARASIDDLDLERPLDADDPEATVPEQEAGLGLDEGGPTMHGGGRVDAAGATYGEADRVGDVAGGDRPQTDSTGAATDDRRDASQASIDELDGR
jgi:hypothetical protein